MRKKIFSKLVLSLFIGTYKLMISALILCETDPFINMINIVTGLTQHRVKYSNLDVLYRV